jgi:histidinol-phosphate aminotransferase
LHRPKVIFITSPNNPDGSIISQEEFDYIINLPVLVVLDEAYIEFSSNSQSRISDVTKHNNLIVLRTFSKRAALAGTDILDS